MKFNQTTSKNSVWLVLSNDFHNTNIRLRARNIDGNLRLTVSQVRHAKKMLCGIAHCTCGDSFGRRGPQAYGKKYTLQLLSDGGASIIADYETT